jgi:hypothetical protein
MSSQGEETPPGSPGGNPPPQVQVQAPQVQVRAAPAARARVFALSPGLAKNQFLDYTENADIKLYNKSIEPMDDKFDLSGEKTQAFLQSFRDRATYSNWQMTLKFTVGVIGYNLIEHYGSVTIEEVTIHAQTYSGALNSRHAQNSAMIYMFLSNSLTAAAKTKLALASDEFILNGTEDGLLYFKVLLAKAHLDNRSTVTMIKNRLSSLDTKMGELQDNIIELNQYARMQVAGF